MDDPVLSRRSIRKYTAAPVGDDLVEKLLRAAMAAPSAGNQQPWQFVVIRDRALLERIPQVHPYAKMLPEAPLAIPVESPFELTPMEEAAVSFPAGDKIRFTPPASATSHSPKVRSTCMATRT